MKRLEIIANQSVRADIIDGLETALPDIEYTLMPTVHGKGLSKRKLGTRTWPETNFLFVSYISESSLEEARKVLGLIKAKYPTEGIFACALEAERVI
jgi:hypothetical protein